MNTLNIERARDILLSYGANPLNWPEAERQDMEACIKHTPALQALQTQESVVDNNLASAHVGLTEANASHSNQLIACVLSRLPEETAEPTWLKAKLNLLISITFGLCSKPYGRAFAVLVVATFCGFLVLSIGINNTKDSETGLALDQWIAPELSNGASESPQVNLDIENLLTALVQELGVEFIPEVMSEDI